MIINNKTLASLCLISSCFAAEPQTSSSSVVVPPLKLASSSIRTIEEHKKSYTEFYALLNLAPFIERLKIASSQGSLPSTLFRPDTNGESVDRFISVLNSVKSISEAAKFEDIQPIMSDLYEIFSVMESTSTVFIPKAIKSVATHIREQTYENAGMILQGTIENLNSYVSYLTEFGNFTESLMRSQKELFLLAARQKDLSKNLPPENVLSRVSQCDFSIERLLVKFKEQLGQAYSLKSVIPETKIAADRLLAELLEDTEPAKVETPRRRGFSLTKSRSKRDLVEKGSSSDAIERSQSADQATSPKTPRGKKKD